MAFLNRTILLCLLSAIAAPLHAATIDITVSSNQFTPNDVTIHPGDTVRWTNSSGFHDVRADNGSFGRAAANSPWTFTQTFNNLGEVRYYCSIHSTPGSNINTSMNGRINVVTVAPPVFNINQGIAGAWISTANSQGFLIDIDQSSNFIFIAWFTYDNAVALAQDAMPKIGGATQRWLTVQGNYTGSGGDFPISNTVGGRFNSSQATTTTTVGTMNVNFSSCTAGTLTYTIMPEGLTGSIAIQRLLPGGSAVCQSLLPPAVGATP